VTAVAAGAEYANPSKQRQGRCSSPLPEPPAPPTDKERDCPWAMYGQMLDQPITIPSDSESDVSEAASSDADRDHAEQSDSTLPSINTLLKQQGRTNRRDSFDSLFEDPDPQCQAASPSFDQASQEPCQEPYPDMASSPPSSPLLSGTPSTPFADDATLGCETRSRISPRRCEPNHSRSTASPAYTPKTPETGLPAPTFPNQQLSWVSSQVDDATRSYGTRYGISPGIDESDRSRGTSPASSTRPGTPKAGSPMPTSPSQPRRRGMGIKADTSCGSGATTSRDTSRSRSPRKRRSNPRRTSQRSLRNISASVNSGPDTRSDSDSDDTSVSSRRQPETYDDEEFHPPYWSECGHGGSGGGDQTETDEELGSPPPKRSKSCRSPASPSRRRRSASTSLDPDTSVAQARTTESACKIRSPPLSHDSSQDSLGSAKFEEWLLPHATLKRVTLGNGRTTFQLQFDWDDRQARCPRSNKSRAPMLRKGNRRRLDAGPRLAFTPEEDELLLKLKNGKNGLTWPAIHRLFSDHFPGRRSQVSLQVHYSTKLKRRSES